MDYLGSSDLVLDFALAPNERRCGFYCTRTLLNSPRMAAKPNYLCILAYTHLCVSLIPSASASLGLAKQLNMEVVAEGVEDQDDWDFLRETKCDIAQGYFVAKPMPAADLPGWITSWQTRMREEFSAVS